MNSVDFIIIAIILISTGISFLRGFVREVLSLFAWIAAVWIAISFTPRAAVLLTDQVSNDNVRILVVFAGLFLATLIVASLINYFIAQLIKTTGFSGTDRMVGVIFGFVRGGLIVSVVVLIVGMTTLAQEHWWRDSLLLEHFQTLAVWLKGNFPENISSQFAYDGLHP